MSSGFNAGVDAHRFAEAEAKNLRDRIEALERKIEEIERVLASLQHLRSTEQGKGTPK